MDAKTSEIWQQLTDFIVFRNSLDLGALAKLVEIFSQDTTINGALFGDQVATFMTAVASQSKLRPNGEADLLSVLAIDGLLHNLYVLTKNGEHFQPNSSSFYGWMSSSQMSMDHSNVSEKEMPLIPDLIAALAINQSFFKRLWSILNKGNQPQKSKKYIDALLDTIDVILGKEKISKEVFLRLRGKNVGLESRRKWQINYGLVNVVIFSDQLNKVLAVLTEGADHIHLALLRIYLSWQSESPFYANVKFSGQEMLFNLYRYYVSSFRDVEEVFEESKHPIFRLMRNHLSLLFVPTLRKFHQMVVRLSVRSNGETGYAFYESCGNVLSTQLSHFIGELSGDLMTLLSRLRDLVQEQYAGQGLIAVKKMFFYSFLLNQSLIQQVYPRHDPCKYSVVYSHVMNLFFHSSLRKFNHLQDSSQRYIQSLIQKISSLLDNKIANHFLRQQNDQIMLPPIRETILNHDYQMLEGVLSSLQFTPKDFKQFEMKKVCVVAPESPVYRHFKSTGFKVEQKQQQLQLATWMSVGGSQDWTNSKPNGSRSRVSEKLKGMRIIDASTRSSLMQEGESFLGYFAK